MNSTTKLPTEYQLWLDQQTWLESSTKKAYLKCSVYLIRWLYISKITVLNEVDLEILYPFIHINNITQKPYAAGHVQIRCAALHLFFTWAFEKGYCRSNPMLLYKKAKVRNKILIKDQGENLPPSQGLSSVQQQRLLAIKEEDIFLDSRNACIVRLLLTTGMLAEELINLVTEDINLNTGMITIQGQRKRTIAIDKTICSPSLQEWFTIRAQLMAGDIPWLFFTRNLKPLYQFALYRIISSYLEKANISIKPQGPPLLRQTAIFNRLQKGDTLEQIQEELGITLARLQHYQVINNQS